jgi:hypothetical protein
MAVELVLSQQQQLACEVVSAVCPAGGVAAAHYRARQLAPGVGRGD